MTTTSFDSRIASLCVPFHCLENNIEGFPGLRYAKCASKFSEFLSQNTYDIVHIHANHGVDYLFAKVAKKSGVRCVVMHSHNTGVTAGAYKAVGHRLFRGLFSSYADGYFACSKQAAEWLMPQKCFERGGYLFVPNGIDLRAYKYNSATRNEMRHELGVGDKFVCGHVGRFNYQKNHEFLIDVFSAIHEKNDKAVLLLVGEGELRDSIEDKVRALDLDECVKFLGARNDIPQLLSAFDILLFPSRFEGLSVVLVEAQAADLPIIASGNISTDTVCSERLEKVPLNIGEWVTVFNELRDESAVRGEQDARLLSFGIKHSVELMDKGYLELKRGAL